MRQFHRNRQILEKTEVAANKFLDHTSKPDSKKNTENMCRLCRPEHGVWYGLILNFKKVLTCGKITNLINHMLNNRYFKVTVGHLISKTFTMLAPTLFNLYTNNMVQTKSRKFWYAYDISIVNQSKNIDDINNLEQYCRKWRHCPNPTKMEVCIIHFSGRMVQK